MKKKLLAAGLSLTLLVTMTACGNSGYKIDSQLSMADEVQSYVDAVDAQYAYDTAYTLAYDEQYLSNELGFRTAGSDAEHKAADFLADQMKEIGLEDIEKVPVEVDKWQFNDASLTIEGTDVDIMPASYATNGTDKDGITAEIVDVGTGKAEDYEGLDVKDKIVLAGVDQWNDAWIDMYMAEAETHGAAAIVTYDVGGYATYSDDMINLQDLCCKDIMPCVSISKNQYNEIAEAIKAGNTTATLTVDNVVEKDKGTSYNVIGKIPGKSSEQQMIFSGHYDVYFNGFQDDSCAIGLILGVAKAMKESGYTPENDIYFVCHGSEEWGALETQYDWTTGAWEMITEAHPEWAEKTIAMFNFELPAFYDGMEQSQISCVPEFASIVKKFASESGLAAVADIYPNGLSDVSVDTNCMEDGISYRHEGVPYFIDMPGTQDGDEGWIQQRYHTAADNQDTYSEDVMITNMNIYGALSIYIDKTPALELDITATCDDLKEAVNEDYADADQYLAAADKLTEAAEAKNARIKDINDRYEKAVADGASEDEIAAIREEGKKENKETLEAFKFIQDNFIGNTLGSAVLIKHANYINNLDMLNSVIVALEKGEASNDEGTGALDIAWGLNGGTEFGFYSFSEEAALQERASSMEKYNPENQYWNTDKGFEYTEDTYKALYGIFGKVADIEAGKKVDFSDEIAIYKAAVKDQTACLEADMADETKAMNKLAGMIK